MIALESGCISATLGGSLQTREPLPPPNVNPNSLFNLRGHDIWVILFLALVLFWIENPAGPARRGLKALKRLLEGRDPWGEEELDGLPGGNRRARVFVRLLLVLGFLVGLISITVAIES